MTLPDDGRWLCLIPYDVHESMSLKEAARIAGKSPGTVKNWCEARGIGRRVAGGTWRVSKVMLGHCEGADRITAASWRVERLRSDIDATGALTLGFM